MDFTPIFKGISTFFPRSEISIKSKTNLKVMLLSPHPDDECLTSSLALRLQVENQAKILNVAVTLGSNVMRKLERKKELKEACKTLKFKNIILSEDWAIKEKELKKIILEFKPNIILAPHDKDIHLTHIKTCQLLKKVLTKTPKLKVIVGWTEFWGQIKQPNLLLEVPEEVLHLQMRALENHRGEISRNPYHLRLPGWMMDNVRRGSEIIQSHGSTSPLIPFGMLYQLQIYQNKKYQNLNCFPYLSSHQDLGQIFKLILLAASESKNISKCS